MSKMVHSILFNRLAICHNQVGVNFFNQTTGQSAVTFSLLTVLPATLLVFEVTWAIDPKKNEHIRWSYDGAGSYQNTAGILMLEQNLNMINCADIAGVIENKKSNNPFNRD